MSAHIKKLFDNSDREKLGVIYEQYKTVMFSTARRWLSSQEDIEDAVSETLLDIANRISRFKDIDSPDTLFLIRIVVKTNAIDILLVKYKSEVTDNLDLAAVPEPDTIDRIADRDALKRISGELPPRYKEFLILRYDMDYSVSEIARLYNMKPNAVKQVITRAKVRFKELLEEEGVHIEA